MIGALSGSGAGWSLSTAMTTLSEGMTGVWGIFTANPLLSIAVAASVAGIVFKVYKKGKGAAGAG